MAVQIVEGFEGGGPENRIWTIDPGSGGTNIVGSNTPGSWSAYSYSAGSSGYISKPMKNQSATEIYLMVRMRSNNSTDQIVFRHPDNSIAAAIGLSAGGLIQIEDSTGTVRATGTNVLATQIWHTIEVHLKVGDAATGLCEVRIEGLTTNECADSTVGDYKNGSQTVIGRIELRDDLFGPAWDDLIVYDSSGSQWNSWVGDKVIVAIFPNGKGTSEQWDPAVASAQRFYFPDGAPGDVGYIGPLYGGGWGSAIPNLAADSLWDKVGDNGGGVKRGFLAPYKRGTTLVNKSGAGGGYTWTSGQDVMMGQFVSPQLAAQTISGTVKMQMQVNASAAADQRSQLVIRVVSADGTTVRGTLYAGDTGSMTDEWSTSRANTTFPQDTISPVTMSSVSAQDGDRLVVEYGFRGHAAGTNVDSRERIGDNGSSGDLPDSESDATTTTTYNPWIEFSNAITLIDDGNWEYVKERAPTIGPDDDGTYVKTATDNDTDYYALDSVPASLTVSGPIAIKTTARKEGPGARSLTHVYNTGGANQTGSAKPLSTVYQIQETLLDVDATNGAVFDDTKITNLQVGPKATT